MSTSRFIAVNDCFQHDRCGSRPLCSSCQRKAELAMADQSFDADMDAAASEAKEAEEKATDDLVDATFKSAGLLPHDAPPTHKARRHIPNDRPLDDDELDEIVDRSFRGQY
jgi:hypothetical protein